jgi:hypothetical protein
MFHEKRTRIKVAVSFGAGECFFGARAVFRRQGMALPEEISMNNAMLLNDVRGGDRMASLVTIGGGRQALAESLEAPAQDAGQLTATEVLLAACVRSLRRLELTRAALFSRTGRSRLFGRGRKEQCGRQKPGRDRQSAERTKRTAGLTLSARI